MNNVDARLINDLLHVLAIDREQAIDLINILLEKGWKISTSGPLNKEDFHRIRIEEITYQIFTQTDRTILNRYARQWRDKNVLVKIVNATNT